jgi:LL-diaminopimelate aminotransferase
MKTSTRLNSLPPYPFAKLENLISRKRQEGIDLISFGIGDPDLTPPDFINQSLVEGLSISGNHNYSSSAGEKSFRDSISSWFEKRFNISLNPDEEICALIGSKEGLAHIFRAFLNSGDTIAIPNPGYPLYEYGGTMLNDFKPLILDLSEESNYIPQTTQLQESDFSGIYLNYPNNPTGAVIQTSELNNIVNICNEKNSIIVYDNAYSEITYGGYKAPSILQCDNARQNSIEFHSLSKTFNMTGYRIGFAVGNKTLIDGLKKMKNQIDSGSPKFIQHAASTALDSYNNGIPPKEILDNIKTYENRMSLLSDGLSKLGYDVKMPSGTFYLWMKVDENCESFAMKLLDNGIVVTPGSGFGNAGDNYVRFSLTITEFDISKALEKIPSC